MSDPRADSVAARSHAGRRMLVTGLVLLAVGIVALVWGTLLTRDAATSLTDQAGAPGVPGIVAIGLGAVLAVIGVVLVLIGATRRSIAHQQAAL